MKQYLKTGDRVYTTGAFLVWHDSDKSFSFDGLEEDTFFDGEPVNFDDMDRPYIEREAEQ